MRPRNDEDGLVLRDWHDLEQFGIDLLTGEADGLSMRLLCDISPAAVEMLEAFWSIKFTDDNNSWNHQSAKYPGWKSVMLSHGIWADLARFALAYRRNCTHIVYVDYRPPNGGWSSHYVQGFESKADFDEWKEVADRIYDGNYHVTWCSGNALGGTRNQHYMSGRAE